MRTQTPNPVRTVGGGQTLERPGDGASIEGAYQLLEVLHDLIMDGDLVYGGAEVAGKGEVAVGRAGWRRRGGARRRGARWHAVGKKRRGGQKGCGIVGPGLAIARPSLLVGTINSSSVMS
ncbi:hypothetical protein GUJ93_ZPchr0010g10162 [Zizania palustris]|uniref:Uncharacterized protein n=1 Tax=Zizania palustris TaxID=103762 RepID=A0A8J5TGR7_ZIZPA|nr:hypothetical protein GUJ93_ZPchr0010g10162 [Zizania palustris]